METWNNAKKKNYSECLIPSHKSMFRTKSTVSHSKQGCNTWVTWVKKMLQSTGWYKISFCLKKYDNQLQTKPEEYNTLHLRVVKVVKICAFITFALDKNQVCIMKVYPVPYNKDVIKNRKVYEGEKTLKIKDIYRTRIWCWLIVIILLSSQILSRENLSLGFAAR